VRYVLSLVLLSSTLLAGQTPAGLDRLLDELAAVRQFKEVAISPDGTRVAWVESRPPGDSAIFVLDWKSSSAKPRRITAGDGKKDYAEHSLAWSTDNARLAFLSDHSKKTQLELYTAPASGGSARQLTKLTGYLADPRWSPDGQRIAFLYIENARHGGGPLEAIPVGTGVIEERIDHQRIATVEVASGAVR
jgi:dipeptidyl aminopeptidase/acylaminoacyl peptidase